MKRYGLVVLMLVVFSGGTGLHAQVPPVSSPLAPDVEQMLYLRACAHFNAAELAPGSPYILRQATCGTPAIMGLASNWPRLSRATKTAFATLFRRPSAQASAVSPGGHFRVHYSTTGRDAVATTDADRNGIPDYVDETARALDFVWQLQVNQLGYQAPPSDGDAHYDVYLKDLSPEAAYGFTYPEVYPENIAHSYMEIDNNFTDNIYSTRGLNGLKVTAAHEFYHAIQFGYYADFGAAWWQELTATWMEDVAYPEINDFYQYLSCSRSYACFFDTPEMSLDKFSLSFTSSLHPFGGSVFAHHLEQVYGAQALRTIWEDLQKRDPSFYRLEYIDASMPMGGFAKVMPRFAVWNYFTDDQSRSEGYYEEAGDFPQVHQTDATPSPGGTFSRSGEIDHLGAAYVRVRTGGSTARLRAVFTLDPQASWQLLALLVSDQKVEVLWPRGTTIDIANADQYQEVVFVPVVTSLSGTGFDFAYTISLGSASQKPSDLIGDFELDGTVNFPDFLAFAQGFGRTHTEEEYNPLLDLNGDGPIDFNDFLIFVSHYGESR